MWLCLSVVDMEKSRLQDRGGRDGAELAFGGGEALGGGGDVGFECRGQPRVEMREAVAGPQNSGGGYGAFEAVAEAGELFGLSAEARGGGVPKAALAFFDAEVNPGRMGVAGSMRAIWLAQSSSFTSAMAVAIHRESRRKLHSRAIQDMAAIA